MMNLRLICPNGQIVELATNNPDGRFIQLKHGGLNLNLSLNPDGFRGQPYDRPGIPAGHFCDAHIIGVVNDDQTVLCWAFEPMPHEFRMDVETLRCFECGLAMAECGGALYTPSAPKSFRHVVGWTDDVHNMRYRGIGRLSLAVQGVRI